MIPAPPSDATIPSSRRSRTFSIDSHRRNWIQTDVDGCEVCSEATDDALRAIAGLTEIQRIYLWDAQVTDAGLEYLRGMKKLRYLHLSNSRITDQGLEILGSISSLEGLSMQGNAFTNRGLASVAQLGRLKSLWVCARREDTSPERISDDGLVHLKALSNLETLALQHTLVTDAGLEHLEALPRLKAVYLNGSRITERGTISLKKAIPGVTVHWSWSK
jgi:Leucine-rich repeat (LRR) protein